MAFAARVEGIQSGAECERLRRSLSALADGDALLTIVQRAAGFRLSRLDG